MAKPQSHCSGVNWIRIGNFNFFPFLCACFKVKGKVVQKMFLSSPENGYRFFFGNFSVRSGIRDIFVADLWIGLTCKQV